MNLLDRLRNFLRHVFGSSSYVKLERVTYTIIHPGYPDKIVTEMRPVGHRHCSTCNKYIPNEMKCDYDWGGSCSVSNYDWFKQSPPVRGSRQE